MSETNPLVWCIGKPLTKPPAHDWRDWLFCVRKFNGADHHSLVHRDYTRTHEAYLGTKTFYAIPEARTHMSLGEMIAAFKAEQAKPGAPPADDRPSWERDPKLRAAMIDRLSKIIVQSHEEGERSNARTMYRKLTGKEFAL